MPVPPGLYQQSFHHHHFHHLTQGGDGYRALSPDKVQPERYAQYVGKETGDSARVEDQYKLAGTPFESNVSPMNQYKMNMSRAQMTASGGLQVHSADGVCSGSKDSSSVMKQIRQTELANTLVPAFGAYGPAALPSTDVIDWQLAPAPVEDNGSSHEELNDKELMLIKYKSVPRPPPKVDLFFQGLDGNFAALGGSGPDSPRFLRQMMTYGQNTTPRAALLRGKGSDPDLTNGNFLGRCDELNPAPLDLKLAPDL